MKRTAVHVLAVVVVTVIVAIAAYIYGGKLPMIWPSIAVGLVVLLDIFWIKNERVTYLVWAALIVLAFLIVTPNVSAVFAGVTAVLLFVADKLVKRLA